MNTRYKKVIEEIFTEKNTYTLIEQPETKTRETLKFELEKSKKRFSFYLPLELKVDEGMKGKTNLELFFLYF